MRTPQTAILIGVCGCALAAHGQMVVHVVNSTAFEIPDDDPNGRASSVNVFASWMTIGSVQVDLRVDSVNGDRAYNGDLYVYLEHSDSLGQTHTAILLNRVGKRDGASMGELGGYDDRGFNVTFSDTASQGDVHSYRSALYGNHTTPIPDPGVLTGTWQPDGRTTDPDFTVAGDARTAMLSGFNGLDPNGTWSLFAADMASGNVSKVTSWGLTVTAVPEPAHWAILSSIALLAFAIRTKASRGVGPG